MSLKDKVKSIDIRPSKSKSVLLYLVFVLISAVFWCFITLNKTVQQDISYRLEITNIPSEVTLIDDIPASINVAVRDKGSAFVKYLFGVEPIIKVRFSDFSDSNTGYFRMNSLQIRNAVKKLLNREATIVSILPDAISLKFTSLPGKKVPIRFDMEIEPDIKYVVNGVPVMEFDSVMVYSDRETLAEINEVYTYHVQESGLTDTLRREVTIAPVVGARVVPRTIHIMVPIEQLIAKRKQVPITVRNLPEKVQLLLSPSVVEAKYLVPKSLFKNNSNDITAIVDYNTFNWASSSNKVAVFVGESPAVYKNIELLPDSVEYIIEKDLPK